MGRFIRHNEVHFWRSPQNFRQTCSRGRFLRKFDDTHATDRSRNWKIRLTFPAGRKQGLGEVRESERRPAICSFQDRELTPTRRKQWHEEWRIPRRIRVKIKARKLSPLTLALKTNGKRFITWPSSHVVLRRRRAYPREILKYLASSNISSCWELLWNPPESSACHANFRERRIC